MKSIAQRIDQLHPNTNGSDTANVQPLLDAVVEDVRPSLLVLMAAVGFVLLIACANIANLQLARAAERHREIAVRMAVGAGRLRLVQQLLTENIVLAFAGGLFGILLGGWLTSALVRATPTGIPRLNEVALDRNVLAFSVILSIFTGVFFGIFPAFQASRASVNDALKEGSRAGTGASRANLRNVLVAAEVAISLILLVGAGLMTRSLWNVVQADGGISTAHVLTARYSLPDTSYADDSRRRTFVDQLTAKIQSIPGVKLAGIKHPLFGGNQTAFIVEGRPMPKPGSFPSVDFGRVTPDALNALGIRLLQGRLFDVHDNESAEKVCIIDETFAKQYFSNESSIGKRISLNGPPAPGKPISWIKIVGVVGHVKNYGVDQPSRVEAYVPFSQVPAFGGTIVLDATGNSSVAVAGIRAAIHSLDADLPVFDVRPLRDIVADASAPRRLAVMLIGSFAALALLLAAVGVYGVISRLVMQRRQEIGIRIALGASSGNILSLILTNGARLAAIGVAVGLLGSFALTRLLSSLLFQVSVFDAATFSIGIVILIALVFLASWLPARRATRIDPLVAIRYE